MHKTEMWFVTFEVKLTQWTHFWLWGPMSVRRSCLHVTREFFWAATFTMIFRCTHTHTIPYKAYLGYSALNSSRPEPAARFKTSVLSCCPSCTLYLLMMAFLCLFHSWNKVFLMIFLGERLMAYLHYAPNQQSFENMQRRASRRGVAPRQRTRATRSSWLGPGEDPNFGKPRHGPSWLGTLMGP